MELALDEGQVYGARYHTVKPMWPEWDSVFNWSDVTPWHDMVAWCVKTYGPTPRDGVWTPGARWYVNNTKFWFKNQEDQMIFMLRWS